MQNPLSGQSADTDRGGNRHFPDPQAIAATGPIYEARLNEEVAEIAAAIPHQDLAIQWDIAAEICFCPGRSSNGESDPDGAAGRLRLPELASTWPAEAELGLHLCYGDPGHKHVVEPKDT